MENHVARYYRRYRIPQGRHTTGVPPLNCGQHGTPRKNQHTECMPNAHSHTPTHQATWPQNDTRANRLASRLTKMLREIELVLAPLLCAGCGADDQELCESCRAPLTGPVHAVPTDGFPVWTCALYAGTTKNVIARWKDHGRAGLNGHLTAVAAGGAAQLAENLSVQTGLPIELVLNKIILVPLPSTRSATKERGFVPSEVVARGLAMGLSALRLSERGPNAMRSSERELSEVDARRLLLGYGKGWDQQSAVGQGDSGHDFGMRSVGGPSASVAGKGGRSTAAPTKIFLNGLAFSRQKRDQTSLSATKRRANLLGSMIASEGLRAAVKNAGILVLVDDVVTTGATMAEARRAICPPFGTFVAGYSLVMTPSSALTAESKSFLDETPLTK